MVVRKNFDYNCKKLQVGSISRAGRNNGGLITVRHRGGGVARLFRLVDFFRYIWNVKSTILTTEYDPNRSALLNLLLYTNGVASYTLLASTIFCAVSSITMSRAVVEQPEVRANYCSYLKNIRPGLSISAIEYKPLGGIKYVRVGYNYAKLVSTAASTVVIKLRSKVLLRVAGLCIASIGVIAAKSMLLKPRRKTAGYTRRVGFRPSVRGVAMNPIDHPHGGGQGKTSGGRVSVTPWALITKGRRTRRRKSYGTFILKR